jgi:hypothetical protein
MEHHILPSLAKVTMVTTTFELWIFCGLFDTFALVVNYINKKWEPCHTTMGIFEVHETTWATMTLQLRDLLVQYDLLNKVLAYVKDEGANGLTNIMSCVPLVLT